jgi:hypothetical protein
VEAQRGLRGRDLLRRDETPGGGGGVAGFEPTTSSSRDFGWMCITAYFRRAVARSWRIRSGSRRGGCCPSVLYFALTPPRCCPTVRERPGGSCREWLAMSAHEYPGSPACGSGPCAWSMSASYTAAVLVGAATGSYIRASPRRAEGPVRLAVGDVSDTRTIPPPFDRPTLVRSMSAGALVALVADGVATPARRRRSRQPICG